MTQRIHVPVLSLLLMLAACGPKGGSSATTTPSEEPRAAVAAESREVEYSDGTTTLKGFIAYPAGNTVPKPAVLVVHEWWGLDDYIRTRAKKLAELGYVAMAVDMYGEGKVAGHPEDAQKFMMEVMSNMDVGIARFRSARKLLEQDPRVDPSRIGAIGYCFGGAVALHMARLGEDLDVVGSFHGNLVSQQPMEAGKFKGQIFVATGAADPFVPPDQVAAFRKEMDASGAKYELVEYAGAKHAFTNPNATATGTKYNLPLAYDPQADSASWEKLKQLLSATWGT